MRNLEIEQQLIFCEKYGINPSELLLLEIILLAQEDDDPELVQLYFKSRMCARGSTIDLLQGLQDAGVILKTYKIPEKGQKFDIFSVPINKNLVKDFHKSSFEMGEDGKLYGDVDFENVEEKQLSMVLSINYDELAKSLILLKMLIGRMVKLYDGNLKHMIE